jgi:hypothetical protein
MKGIASIRASLFFCVLSALAAPPARAETVTAATCELADVQGAVDGAADGDVVQIPAGTCTWTAALALDLEFGGGRALVVTGAGIDATTIHVRKGLADVQGAAGKGWRLSGLTLVTEYDEQELTAITVGGASVSWRIDHIKFDSRSVEYPPLRHIHVHGSTYGLIDHCVMTGEVASAVVVDGENWQTWREPQAWGTAEAVYIEDNLFQVEPPNEAVAAGTTDCQRGGRFVFRHNTVHNQITQCHGFDSGQHASCMSMEVYANTGFITTDTTAAWAWLGQIRGGTALWFDNTWEVDEYSFPPTEAGVWLTDAIALRVYRAEGSPYNWHACDGTPLRLCSNIDAGWNMLDNSWWPLSCTTDADCTADRHMGDHDAVCKWRFCSGNAMALCDPASGDADCEAAGLGTCTGFLDGPDDGTPCFQQPGRSTDNGLSPAYEWNNSCEGAQPSACEGGLGSGNVHYGEDIPQLVENVDYYNFRPDSFDGTEGTGRGPLADRPATCTPTVAYWDTDSNTLYCCESPDTWIACYTPYPYPHPLQSGPTACGNGLCEEGETCDSCPGDCCPEADADADVDTDADADGSADSVADGLSDGGLDGQTDSDGNGGDDGGGGGCGCAIPAQQRGPALPMACLLLGLGLILRRLDRKEKR